MSDLNNGRPLRELLHFAAAQHDGDPLRTNVLRWGDVDGRHFQLVRDAGLGPLQFRALRSTAASIPTGIYEALKSADLTAQVRHGMVRDTVSEIVDAGQEDHIRIALLKGVSIADQFYPLGHLRPMGDIDILVSKHDYAAIESKLLNRGYVPKPEYETDEFSPHGVPLFHPQRQVWVEIHTSLFPGDSGLCRNELFSPASVATQSVASTFDGRPVYRLTNELQLVYIASYWIRDLTRSSFHPSFVVPLLDAIYLLKAIGPTLDWDGLFSKLDNTLAMASLYLLLDYLRHCGFATFPPTILPRLATGQKIVGPPERRIISAMLDTYLFTDVGAGGSFIGRHPMMAQTILGALLAEGSHAGKLLSLPWNVVFPPGTPDRYSLRYHRGRIGRLLNRGR